MQCAELSRNELDFVLLGQIAALLSTSTQTASHRPSTDRKRTTMSFHHAGQKICRKTFQVLHGIGKLTTIDMTLYIVCIYEICVHTHTIQ